MAKKGKKKNHQNPQAQKTNEPSGNPEPREEETVTTPGGETPEPVASGQPAGSAELSVETADTVRKLEEQLAALNEKYVRLVAEYDNYRKRTAREMASAANIASERLLLQFLPILDNLDRATEHKNDKTTFEEYVKGIALIEDQLRRVLSQAGLRKMDVLGQPFDPAAHSAILQTESPEHGPGIIIAEVEKGYLFTDKIIRHPKVVVSK